MTRRRTHTAKNTRATKRKSAPLTPEQRAWRKLSTDKQLAIVREVVETRAPELSRAYKDVVSVTAGVKRSRERKVDKQLLRRPVPAVIFTVKKKLGKRRVKPNHKIPVEIFTYHTIARKRVRCAIPTDVECRTQGIPITPDNRKIAVAGRTGVITCAVKLPRKKGRPRPFYAMSCRHVFKNVGEDVRLGGDRIAVTTNKRGELVRGPNFSFDAALAEVTDSIILGHALEGLHIPRRAGKLSDIPLNYWILTGRGALRAQYRSDYDGTIDYSGIPGARHAVLIESRMLDEVSRPGDSGSPVTTLKSGGMLLGMHISGNGDAGGDSALMIPAWELLMCSNYQNVTPRNMKLSLWSKV